MKNTNRTARRGRRALPAITLALAILAGCSGTDVGDDAHIVPPATSTDSEILGDPTAASDGYIPQPGIPFNLPPLFDAPIDLTPTNELVVYIPAPGNSTWGWDAVIDRFRNLYPDVNLVVEKIVTPISQTDSFTAYTARLTTEIAAGKGPDVFLPSVMRYTDLHKMANAGAFLDFNKIIEQDKSFNLDDYIKPILDGGIYRGRRFIMPFEYAQPVILISIPEKTNEIEFDMSQMDDISSFLNEIVRTLPKARENPHFQKMVDLDVYTDLFIPSGIQLVDFENGVILPDEVLMKDIFDAYKPYHSIASDYKSDLWPPIPAHLQDGTVIFASPITMDFFIKLVGQLKAIGIDYQMHVMPGMNGEITARSDINSVAIRAGSPNQLNAWNFIKLLFEPSHQSSWYIKEPIHIDSISVAFDSLHNHHKARTRPFEPLSDEEKQTYIDLVTTIDNSSSYNLFYMGPIVNMFSEHMTPYFEDKVSYETAIAGLRNQLRLYVSE
jgi:multiple sugar transport system substrate-binding protein